MDKYSWIGLFLIALIIFGFTMLNRPSPEQLEAQRRYNDSIQMVEAQRQAEQLAKQQLELQRHEAQADTASRQQLAQQLYGTFAQAALGEEQLTVVQTEKLILTFSNKGGRISQAQLKEYKAYGDTVNPLSLFKDDEASLDFVITSNQNRYLHTADLYFQKTEDTQLDDGTRRIVFNLPSAVENASLDFVYLIPADDYMVHFDIVPHNAKDIFSSTSTSIDMLWNAKIPQQERGRKFEDRYATLQYMFTDGDVKKLDENKNEDKERINTSLRWIAYKDQFFSTVIIADSDMEGAEVVSRKMSDKTKYIKEYSTLATMPFEASADSPLKFRVYLGPNHYNTLKAYDKDVEKEARLNLKKLVPLGWKIVSWINMILVIPMFDLFTSWGLHIGLIIFLMTLVIKIIILPFVFSSYRSTAKMRVLKPQIEEINQKYPPEKMQERQQATMALYNKAGVSPMSGCLPMLFQFPVLMAMFWFFPTAIELRGKSFLWADDLSAYDAIITWSTNIPLIGNHLSLFCLLMTAANIAYTYFNMQTQAGGGTEMKIMKYMMYLMPLMFFFIFNDYAAGLSYYYLLSLLITILQTMIFRWAIDDEKLLREMQAKQAKNAAKPKKSGFMARLEKMQREQQQIMREQAKKNARR